MFSYLFGVGSRARDSQSQSKPEIKEPSPLQYDSRLVASPLYLSQKPILTMATAFIRTAKESKKQHATQDYATLQILDQDRVLLTIDSLKRLSYRGEIRFECKLGQYLRKKVDTFSNNHGTSAIPLDSTSANHGTSVNYGSTSSFPFADTKTYYKGSTVVDDYEILEIMPRYIAYALLWCIVKSIKPKEVQLYWSAQKNFTYINFT